MTRMLALDVLVPALAFAQGTPPDPVAVSTRLLDHLDAGEFAAAEAMFDPRVQAAVPQSKLLPCGPATSTPNCWPTSPRGWTGTEHHPEGGPT